ncbi:hypothetical protein B0H11DRAFT_2274984, partial [Mycena galericulata]
FILTGSPQSKALVLSFSRHDPRFSVHPWTNPYFYSGTAFETIFSSEQAGQNQIYRIFSYRNTRFRREAGIVKFTAIPPHTWPTTDYWYIRVGCHIILYLFPQQAVNRASTAPEIALAHQIYAKLLKIRGTPLQPAPSITVDDEAELSETESVSSHLSSSPSSLSPTKPGVRRRTSSGRLAPTYPCGHEHLGNTKKNCKICYDKVPKSATISAVVAEYEVEDTGVPKSATRSDVVADREGGTE